MDNDLQKKCHVVNVRPIIFVLAFIGLLLLSVYVGYALGLKKSGEVEVSSDRDKAIMIANLLALDHESSVSGIRQFLISTSNFIQELPGDSAVCDSILKRMHIVYPYFLNVGIVDTNGDIVCSGVETSNGLNYADDEDFKQLISTKSFTVSNYKISQITGRPSVRFMYPIFNQDKELIGSIFVSFGVEWLNGFPTNFNFPKDIIIIKFDNNGTVFMRYPDPVTWSGTNQADSQVFNLTKASKNGFEFSDGLDGINRLYYFRPIFHDGSIHGYVFVGVENTREN